MDHPDNKSSSLTVAHHFIPARSEMGKLMLSRDWSDSSLGPMEEWPSSLTTALNIMFNSGYPMFVWWGPELIMFHNDAYIPVLGEKHPHALGESAREVWAELWGQIGKAVEDVFKGKRFDARDLLMLLNRKGFLEETYWTFSYSPFLNDSGTIGGLFCACNEETDKIIRQRRLKTLNELSSLSTEYKSMAEIYSVLSAKIGETHNDVGFTAFYQIDRSNKAKLLSYSGIKPGKDLFPYLLSLETDEPSWVQGLNTNEIRVVSGFRSALASVLNHSLSVDSMAIIPIQRSGKNELEGFLICGISPYLEFNEEYRSFFKLISSQVSTTIADVRSYEEERKRVEKLQELDRAKTTFFSNISHEFRTPLTLILAPVEDLMSQVGDRSDLSGFKEQLKMIQRNGIMLQKLVNTLLDFSKIEARKTTASFELTDISSFSGLIASSFETVIQKAGLEFTISTEEISQEVYVDREMWEKIILNLLSNALKFTFKGKISLEVRSRGKQVELRVTDTGVGISEAHQKHIFDRFYRIEGTPSRSFEGSGIGLSLVRELVRFHGGKITVESTLGQGSSFIISLPTGKRHLDEKYLVNAGSKTYRSEVSSFVNETLRWAINGDTDQEPVSTPTTKSDRILVVDDSPDMRNYLKGLLEKHFEVILAEDGISAQKQLTEAMPNLVLTDVMMPGMDGFELLNYIKHSAQMKHLPVILLSARAGEESQIDALDSGADDFLVKPFSSRQLIARIRAQLKIAATKHHSETQLTRLFMQAPVAMCILRGPKFVVEVANDQILQLWGKSREEVLNLPVFTGIPEARDQGYEELLEKVYMGGERFIANELPLRLTRQGKTETIHVKLIYEPLRDENGSITGIMAMADDVTAQVTIREHIRESEAQQRFLSSATKILSETLDYDNMLKALAKVAVPKLGDFCILDLLVSDVEIKRIAWAVADPGKQKVFDEVVEVSSIMDLENHPVSRVIQSGKTELLDHIDETLLKQIASGDYISFLKSLDIHSMLIVPLAFGETPFGAIKFCISNTERSFNKADVNLAEELSKRVSIAIHNANMYEQAQKEIIKRKHIENDLKISEARFRAMSDSVPIMIRVSDRTGACTYWNKLWYDYTGQPQDQSLGTKWIGVIHPDDQQETLSAISTAIEARKPFELYYRLKGTNGKYRWHMDSGLPKYSEEGWLEGFIGTVVDIHERKLAEDALMESEDKLRHAIEATKLGTWDFYPESSDLICSDRCKELFGLPPSEAVTYRLFLLGVHKEDRRKVDAAVRQSLHPKNRHPFEVEFRTIGHDDGKLRWIRAKGEAFFNEKNDAVRLVGTVLDITERKFLEQQKDDFLGIASHELKTPVTSIKGNVQVLEHTLRSKGDAHAANQLQKVDRQINKLVSLINDLLDVTKIETGKMLFTREDFDFDELVDEVVKSMQFVSVNHILKRTGDTYKAIVNGDRNRIEQVITNLISNAIKYSPGADKVIVNTSIGQGVVNLSVQDFGPGLSSEHLNKVFDRFYRVSGANNWASGLGLGLYISAEIVGKHNGKIWVESILNEGSTFYVSLPLNLETR